MKKQTGITVKEMESLKAKIKDLIFEEIPIATAGFSITLLDEIKSEITNDALSIEIKKYK